METAPSEERQIDPALTVFLPVHNEAANITNVLRSFYDGIVRQTEAEFLVCEDGSTDGTDRVLRSLAGDIPMHLVAGGQRKGYGGAVHDGLLKVRTPYTFFADSDGQYHPEDFWRLWSKREGYDLIIGVKTPRREPLHRLVLARGFHVLTKALFGIRLSDIDCGFRIIRRELIETLNGSVRDLPYSFWAEFTILAAIKGYRILEVPISHSNRLGGSTTIYRPRSLPRILWSQVKGLIRLRRRIGAMA